MKVQILKWIFLFVATANIAACAFSKDTNEENAREQQDRDQLLQNYSQVTGLYRGTVTTEDTVQQVEISLYTTEIQDGFTSNGDPKFRPVLKATYNRLDIVTPDVTLQVRQVPELGQVHMSNSSTQGTATTMLTVDATVTGNSMTGTVTTNSGTLGTLNAQLITKEAHAPTQGDQDEQNERAKRIFAKVAGTYEGILQPNAQTEPKQRIVLTLYVGQENTSDRGPVPVLLGRSQNMTYDPVGSFTAILKALYQPDANPPKITLVSTQVIQNPNSTYQLSIDGTIVNGVLHATYVDNLKSQGIIDLKLQQ